MKISFNWLLEFVEFGLSPGDLADRLTNVGLEVEAVSRVTQRLDGIVVGRIARIEPHPNADRLSVCRVQDGAGERTVVCGARNMTAGDCAPLAVPGCKLPDGTVIREAVLRGVRSEGMLCSERELGLGEAASGIMILDGKCVPGAALAGALGLDDHVLDINVTPNRPDCLSVLGIAREVGAMLEIPVRAPRISVKEVREAAGKYVAVSSEDGSLCGLYSARAIKNVKNAASPFRMRYRLGMSGMRAVSGIVDVTNYVLIERGQPLHAFDLGKIRGGKIAARAARDGEKLVTIDGLRRELQPGMLVIADAEAPVAVAGIMGGRDTEVGAHTGTVLLESAFFRPQSVRRTSAALGLSSESSYRFERGVDYGGVIPALNRAAQLISSSGMGDVCKGVVACRPSPRRAPALTLRIGRVNSLLHTGLSQAGIERLLRRLSVKTAKKGREELKATPPSYRVDLKEEVDLIEEVARLNGYGAIKAIPPSALALSSKGPGNAAAGEKAADMLCSLGFSEAVNLSFMGREEMDRLRWGAGEPLRCAVRLGNPVSEEYSYLRTSMLPPMMRCLALNAARGNQDVRLFEISNVFYPGPGASPPLETEKLALAAMGHIGRKSWCSAAVEADYFYLKGVIQSVASMTGKRLSARRAALPSCHRGRCAALSLDGAAWGWLAEIHPGVCGAYGIRGPVVFAELDTGPLYKGLSARRLYSAIPRFPSARRDIAMVVDDSVDAEKIMACVNGAAPDLIEEVELFDLFKGEQIPPGKKGLAISVVLRSKDSTLSDEDISKAVAGINEALRGAGCEIRK